MKPRFVTTALTLLVLIAVVGGAGYWGWKHTTAPVPGLGPQQVCTTKTVDATMKPGQVTVSVYNAGTKVGLAGDTMRKLVKLGFVQGETANTTEKVRTVLVRTTKAEDPAATLVAAQFGTDVKIVVSTTVDLGPGIDVVIGNKFQGLVPKAIRSVPYTTEQQVCSAP